MEVLFPRLRLLEDTFCIYQKIARLERPGNRLLTGLLTRMDVREFGDAIGSNRPVKGRIECVAVVGDAREFQGRTPTMNEHGKSEDP